MRPFHTTSFPSSYCFCLCHASIPRCQLHHHLPVVKGSLCNTTPLPLLRLLSEQRQGKQRRSMLSDAARTSLPKVREWASAATSSPRLSTCGHLSAQTDLHSNTLPSAPGKRLTDTWQTSGIKEQFWPGHEILKRKDIPQIDNYRDFVLTFNG